MMAVDWPNQQWLLILCKYKPNSVFFPWCSEQYVKKNKPFLGFRYQLMLECWCVSPNDRPTFSGISGKLNQLAGWSCLFKIFFLPDLYLSKSCVGTFFKINVWLWSTTDNAASYIGISNKFARKGTCVFFWSSYAFRFCIGKQQVWKACVLFSLFWCNFVAVWAENQSADQDSSQPKNYYMVTNQGQKGTHGSENYEAPQGIPITDIHSDPRCTHNSESYWVPQGIHKTDMHQGLMLESSGGSLQPVTPKGPSDHVELVKVFITDLDAVRDPEAGSTQETESSQEVVVAWVRTHRSAAWSGPERRWCSSADGTGASWDLLLYLHCLNTIGDDGCAETRFSHSANLLLWTFSAVWKALSPSLQTQKIHSSLNAKSSQLSHFFLLWSFQDYVHVIFVWCWYFLGECCEYQVTSPRTKTFILSDFQG